MCSGSGPIRSRVSNYFFNMERINKENDGIRVEQIGPSRKKEGISIANIEDLKMRLVEAEKQRQQVKGVAENVDIFNHLTREIEILKEEIGKLEHKN